MTEKCPKKLNNFFKFKKLVTEEDLNPALYDFRLQTLNHSSMLENTRLNGTKLRINTHTEQIHNKW